MVKDSRRSAAVLIFAVALAGCGPVAAPEATPTAMVAPEPTAAPPTLEPSPMAEATTSFEAAKYRNAEAGFEFDYPATWLVGPSQQQSRGGITALTSWPRPMDVFPDETPPGETRMDVTVQLWDPTGDLEAFLAQRRLAWDASGIEITAEERWTLDDGRAAAAFIVEGTDGAPGYFCFTTIGDRYLVLSGNGDLALLAEIAHTLRAAPLEY